MFKKESEVDMEIFIIIILLGIICCLINYINRTIKKQQINYYRLRSRECKRCKSNTINNPTEEQKLTSIISNLENFRIPKLLNKITELEKIIQVYEERK